MTGWRDCGFTYNNNNNNNNNFIVQFIEWKYILHFGDCIKTQYLSHVVMHVYNKIKHVNSDMMRQ